MRRLLAAVAVASMVSTTMVGTGAAGAARTGGPRRAWTVAGTSTSDDTTPACDVYHAVIEGHVVIDVTVGTAPRPGSLHLDLCITSVALPFSRPTRSTTRGGVVEPDLINIFVAGTFTLAEPDGRASSGTATGTEYVPSGASCPSGLVDVSESFVLTQTARHPGGVPRRSLSLQLAWCSAGGVEPTDSVGGTLGWVPAA